MNPYNTSQSHSANFYSADLETTAQTPLTRNDNREGLIIFNDSDQSLLVSFTDTVSADEYAFKVLAGGYYESGATVYMGDIHLMWTATGTGKALITELEV